MKKILLAVAAVALVACGGKTGIEKELVGDYKAEIALPDMPEDDAAAQVAAAIFAQIKLEMNFKSDGTVETNSTVGTHSEPDQGKWEVKADSLFLIMDTKTQRFQVTKTDNGFKLNNEEIVFILTPKED